MKKIGVFLVLSIFLISLVFAAQGDTIQTQQNNSGSEIAIQKTIQSQNRLQEHLENGTCPNNCTCGGSVIKCQVENGREMTVRAGNSGNTIVQTKGANVSTKVQLYKSEDGSLIGMFKNKNSSIILPDQIQDKVREKLKQQDCDCENMVLDEDGIYQIQTQKQSKLFGLFPVKERVKLQYDAETGELIKARNSWWGFLARDTNEKSLE